jgi:hypothetical protein
MLDVGRWMLDVSSVYPIPLPFIPLTKSISAFSFQRFSYSPVFNREPHENPHELAFPRPVESALACGIASLFHQATRAGSFQHVNVSAL